MILSAHTVHTDVHTSIRRCVTIHVPKRPRPRKKTLDALRLVMSVICEAAWACSHAGNPCLHGEEHEHDNDCRPGLWKERSEPTWLSSRGRRATRPICPWCNEFVWFADDTVMHEWLIRRVRLPIKTQFKIMHEYNCVLSHVSCHEQHETTREFKLRCARAQYKRYGRDTIVFWVESLGLKQHIEIPEESEGQQW